MSTHRSCRLDRRTAEHLLRGQPDPAAVPGAGAVSNLLAAASAPARERELAGEQAALAAFRAAHPTPVPQLRRRSMIKTTLAKLLTMKIAAAAVGVVAAGGVAVAAVTGTLSTQPGGTAPAPATSHATGTPSAAASHTSTGADQGKAPATGDKEPGDSAAPAPSLVGLCHAYTAGAGAEHGKALDDPAFGVLITTAGGRDNVPAYCTGLLAAEPAATHPGDTPHPGEAHQTKEPPTHAKEPPTTHPGH